MAKQSMIDIMSLEIASADINIIPYLGMTGSYWTWANVISLDGNQ